MPQQICGYDISPTLSTSSNEDSSPINTLQFAIVQTPSYDFYANKQNRCNANSALNRRICNDLRLSANKSFSQNVRPARPYLPPRRVDGSTYSNRNSFDSRLNINRLSEKRQSDPQIRYAFYNKGFEVATSTKHRKYSLSQYEVRRKAMPDIDEYGSMGNDENEESSDEWQGSHHSLQYYSGSSGRDITLLPKLKIRICDEMGERIKHSFDESSFSDENFNADESSTPQTTIGSDSIDLPQPPPPPPTKVCEHKSNETTTPAPTTVHSATVADSPDNEIPICKKCGHRLTLQKQFTNAFT